MDANKHKIRMLQVERTIKALQDNHMDAFYVPSAEAAVAKVESMLVKNETVAIGGSMTLKETGILQLLGNGNYHFLDRYQKDLTEEETERLFREAFFADTYLCSANAVTEHGEIYCVDGRSNRIAAMLYGPRQVLLVTSCDKIVPNLAKAVERVKQIAAPANAARYNAQTHCNSHGHCMKAFYDKMHLMALGGGACEHTLCSNSVVFSSQQIQGRMKVLFVGESLGY